MLSTSHSSRAMSTTRQAQTLPNEEESLHSSSRIRQTPRRTLMLPPLSPSDSSDSSIESSISLSLNEENSPFSPTTPLKLIDGVPFAWEQIPGMPKRQGSIKKEPSGRRILPLPPAGNSNSNSNSKKLSNQDEISPKKHQTSGTRTSLKRDPFFAALVACSKDERDHDTYFGSIWKGRSKISRSLSDGFGFMNMQTSCKRSCAISESIVYLSKSSPYHYNLLNRRPN
ncbi:uncharacterized protein [Henckelia pumila]|uniref:uncharacterized protein n=1 Tax=Henckelia pumila TaxID=405737 RepID=UPI003C6DFECA